MGKAKRWFKGLLGLKKDKEIVKSSASNFGEKRVKMKWGFAKPDKDSGGSTRAPADPAWKGSYVDHDSEEQSKHAIAVAAASAYAADAAFAAAQAAVAVVRLTSQGKGTLFTAGGKEYSAAVKIQNVFRGFLARKALKALKGLVKLQALVKGYLVRKRAAAALHSMQALFWAQNAARAQRARASFNDDRRPEIRARKSIERFDENRSEFHSKRLSSCYDSALLSAAHAESPKIVEIDTCGPKSRSRRFCMPEYGDDHYYHAVSSPLPCLGTARLSVPYSGHLPEYDWGYITEDYRYATAQNTPRFSCSGRAYGPVTPGKSVCGDAYFRNYPNYMANTQSFRAKTRSHSAPRHRPEQGPKKQLSLEEMMESRSSFSGVRMQRAQDGFEM